MLVQQLTHHHSNSFLQCLIYCCVVLAFFLCTCTYTSSVSGFEFTSESGLFDLLDVQLYHGWLVDPQEAEISEVIGHHSYNQLVEMIVNSKSSDDQEKISKG